MTKEKLQWIALALVGISNAIVIWMMITVLLLLSSPRPCSGQGTNSQLKTVIRPTLAINDHWYVASWNITNFRDNASDNTNVMLGIGVKGNGWWLESMAMKQYAMNSNQWLLDFRFQTKLPHRGKMFVEVSPFLEQQALFQFIRADRPVGKFAVGVESENVFRQGRDSLGVGPMLTFPPIRVKAVSIIPTLAYQYRFNEPGFVRLYVAVPLQLRK